MYKEFFLLQAINVDSLTHTEKSEFISNPEMMVWLSVQDRGVLLCLQVNSTKLDPSRAIRLDGGRPVCLQTASDSCYPTAPPPARPSVYPSN